jgi:hypothetical protein
LSAPIAVAVCVEPFLLRSALHAALVADGRFAPSLCPVDEAPSTWGPASGARMLLTSEHVAHPDLCVVTLSFPGETVSVCYSGACTESTYVDTADLCDQLVEQAAVVHRASPNACEPEAAPVPRQEQARS